LWFTGLSGSGKSTIALGLEKKLHNHGFFTQILDGDNVRTGICNNLSFTLEDRKENIRRISETSKLFCNSGIICINSFVSPTREIRNMAKEIIGKENFLEVFVNTPLHVCESRDVKGLYKKARNGEIKGFTGIDSPYEPPINPDIEILTENKPVETCVDICFQHLHPHIRN
jgi:adenylylsulfate kinase